jgi:leucyl aminopeptidase
MQAIGRTKPQVNVTAWLSCAENMPSGTAQRPSDVVTMRNGTTVEVTNTDAEGRLVLGDALVRAGEDQPDLIVDIATLTGACIMAFGPLLMGVMGNDDAERTKLIADAEAAGERAWALPMPDDLRSVLDSPTADLQNSAMSRFGGALVAAHFLKAFIGTRPDGTPIPWVHIDLGGPAWTEAARDGITPRGGTGAGVRTLVSALHRIAADA